MLATVIIHNCISQMNILVHSKLRLIVANVIESFAFDFSVHVNDELLEKLSTLQDVVRLFDSNNRLLRSDE
jgi:hypothetical protein